MENRLFLQFNCPGGHILDLFLETDLLHAIKCRVLASTNSNTVDADEFVVVFQGKALDETKTLSSLGVHDLSVLFIARRRSADNSVCDLPE